MQDLDKINYSLFVSMLFKDGADILKTMTPEKMDTLHAGVGVSGEAGELLDAIKKWVVYNKPLDRDNVIEELGDIEFYLQRIRSIIGVSRERVLEGNKQKLSKRYEGLNYSDQAAQDRADKEPVQ